MPIKNDAVLLIGSNIEPEKNVKKCIALLSNLAEIKKASSVWRTRAVGSEGPDFLNLAVQIVTPLNAKSIHSQITKRIETQLKRVRKEDVNAPRTIDIDLIVFNGEVQDDDLWNKLFVSLPVSEILPDLKSKSCGKTLLQIVNELKSSAEAELVEDLDIHY